MVGSCEHGNKLSGIIEGGERDPNEHDECSCPQVLAAGVQCVTSAFGNGPC
jgi:hypothetical protein